MSDVIDKQQLIALLKACFPYIESQVEHDGYGLFPGGYPTKFIPDDDNTPEQLRAWKVACDRWKESQAPAASSHQWLTNDKGEYVGTATVANLGMGSYTYIDGEAERIVKEVKELAGEDTTDGV